MCRSTRDRASARPRSEQNRTCPFEEPPRRMAWRCYPAPRPSKAGAPGSNIDESMGVTCTGICIALRVVLTIPWLSILVAASAAEDALRQPELIEFRSGDLDLKGFIWKPAGARPIPRHSLDI